MTVLMFVFTGIINVCFPTIPKLNLYLEVGCFWETCKFTSHLKSNFCLHIKQKNLCLWSLLCLILWCLSSRLPLVLCGFSNGFGFTSSLFLEKSFTTSRFNFLNSRKAMFKLLYFVRPACNEFNAFLPDTGSVTCGIFSFLGEWDLK